MAFVAGLLTAPLWLAAPACAQMQDGGGSPHLNLIPDAASKTPEQKEAEEARDKAYKESLRKIPDAKVSSDPWGNVRTDTPKTSAKTSAKPRTKTGSAAN
jgi:hypothetical protein